MSIFLNGVETNTVMLNGVDTTGVWNGEVVWGVPPIKTLTLYHSEGGTLTANELTGYPGDTINLSTAYNTYWRFSGYQWTGDGELANNTYTFGDEDATICACYKVNAFTAKGGWEKGSNINCIASNTNNSVTQYIGAKYATHTSHTGDIPASWYSTSNRWKPSNASAYSITLNPKITVTAKKNRTLTAAHANFTGVTVVGSTYTQSQSFSLANNTATQTFNYNKSFTSNSQSNYAISGKMVSKGYYNGAMGQYTNVTSTYVANNTNGGWTATGYAP